MLTTKYKSMFTITFFKKMGGVLVEKVKIGGIIEDNCYRNVEIIVMKIRQNMYNILNLYKK